MLFKKQIEKNYRRQMFVRCDDIGVAYYFSDKDFDGLKKKSYAFKSNRGDDLQGYFYWYDNPKANRLVIFDHGMGGGHRSYMREIETIAKMGYMVLGYDHTGCMESGGENTGGFAQSLSDLDCCVSALKRDRKFTGGEITVIGHSWGGFAALNIAAFHPDIKNIVTISAFVSVKAMIEQYFGGFLSGYRKGIFEIEKQTNGKYALVDGVETLKNSPVKTLVIHSADDPMVKRENHFDRLRNALGDKPGVVFHLENGKAHNPNYTADAVKYKDGYVATVTEKLKRNELDTPEKKKEFVAGYDWWAMTAQDMRLWNMIFEFIEE